MLKRLIYLIFFHCITYSLYAQTPHISFTENKNQWPENVKFRSSLFEGYLYAEKNCLTYQFFKTISHSHAHGQTNFHTISIDSLNKELQDYMTGKIKTSSTEKKSDNHAEENDSIEYSKSHSYKVFFNNMNSKTQIISEKELPGYENFFLDKNHSKWAHNVKSYSTIQYKNIYKNIDLQLYDNNGTLKYDFIVKKGGNPKKIELEYSGVSRIEINSIGSLILYTSINQVHELKPYAFQIIDNDTIEIPCSYNLTKNIVTYNLGKYDTKHTLFIDPQLIFSTYTGSISDNWGFTATYDFNNNVYAGGIVENIGYPVNVGAFQTVFQGGNWDVGIIKYDPTGTNRLFATYLGGNSSEMPHSLIVNSNNELLVLGTTSSTNFPTIVAYDSTFNGGKSLMYDGAVDFSNGVDMFVAKLSEDGSQLLSATYMGGTANDGINYDWEIDQYYGHDSLYHNYGDGARGEIMVDQNNNIYIASTTFSSDFPTFNAMQPTFGGMQDGVICKFTPDLSSLVWSTYVGGTSKDAAYSIDVDINGNSFVTGGTCSPTLGVPVTGFIQNRIGGTVDAFIVNINQFTGALQGSTYYGSNVYDQAYFVRTNEEGNVYIFGQTNATGSTLIYNALYNRPNSGQFLAAFSNDLSTLIWSTVFGSGNGRPNISPTAFEVDICNRIYLAGAGRDWASGPSSGWYFDANAGYHRRDDFGWRTIEGTKNLEVTPDAYQLETDGQDFYIMVIDDEANNLDYATFFGELNYGGVISYDGVTATSIPCYYSGHDHVDGGTSRFDSKGFIYQSVCASCGGCNGFPIAPVPDVWSASNNSTNCNNAVMRFFIDFGLLIADFDLPEIGCQTKSLEFNNTTQIYYTNPQIEYTWDFGDGSPISNEISPVHIYNTPGEYLVKLLVQDSSACNMSDSITKRLVIVNDIGYDSIPAKNICQGDTVEIGLPNAYDSLLTYEWLPITHLDTINRPHANAWPDTTTIYTLTVSQGWCQTVYTQPVNVFNNTYAITDIIVTQNGFPKNPICKGESAILTAVTNAPTQRYLWATSRNFYPSTIINTDFSRDYIEVNPTVTTTYYLQTLSRYCQFGDLDSVTIIVSYNLIIATGDALICSGDIIPLHVENLTPEFPVEYSWTPKIFVALADYTDSPLVNPTTNTDFIVYATNVDGCITQDTVTVLVDELLINTFVNNPISCFGETDAAIHIAPLGIEPYAYIWDDGSTIPSKYNIGAGTYIITVTDSLGCSNTREFIIIEPELLRIQDTTLQFVTCEQACNGSIIPNVQGGTLPYNYNWSHGDTSAIATNLCQGNYSLSVTDAHGCSTQLPNYVHIGLFEKLPYLHAYADDYTLFKGQTTLLHPNENPIDSIEYNWFPNLWLENYNSAIATANPQETFTYYVRAKDIYGCSSIDTVTLTVTDWECDYPFIYVPTAFSPNGDGTNDILKVESGVITELHFVIYDRWGEKIFETSDVDITWDGTYLDKPLPPQVLVYYIEATCFNQQVFSQKGNITLIK